MQKSCQNSQSSSISHSDRYSVGSKIQMRRRRCNQPIPRISRPVLPILGLQPPDLHQLRARELLGQIHLQELLWGPRRHRGRIHLQGRHNRGCLLQERRGFIATLQTLLVDHLEIQEQARTLHRLASPMVQLKRHGRTRGMNQSNYGMGDSGVIIAAAYHGNLGKSIVGHRAVLAWI